jgi:hypothetical protein
MKDINKLKKELMEIDSIIKDIELNSVEFLKSIFDTTLKQKEIIDEILMPNLCPYCKENNTDSFSQVFRTY